MTPTNAERDNMPVTDYSDAELVKRAINNATPHCAGYAPLWVAVMDTFGLGSTYAIELCRLHGLDPDKEINGVRCVACNP